MAEDFPLNTVNVVTINAFILLDKGEAPRLDITKIILDRRRQKVKIWRVNGCNKSSEEVCDYGTIWCKEWLYKYVGIYDLMLGIIVGNKMKVIFDPPTPESGYLSREERENLHVEIEKRPMIPAWEIASGGTSSTLSPPSSLSSPDLERPCAACGNTSTMCTCKGAIRKTSSRGQSTDSPRFSPYVNQQIRSPSTSCGNIKPKVPALNLDKLGPHATVKLLKSQISSDIVKQNTSGHSPSNRPGDDQRMFNRSPEGTMNIGQFQQLLLQENALLPKLLIEPSTASKELLSIPLVQVHVGVPESNENCPVPNYVNFHFDKRTVDVRTLETNARDVTDAVLCYDFVDFIQKWRNAGFPVADTMSRILTGGQITIIIRYITRFGDPTMCKSPMKPAYRMKAQNIPVNIPAGFFMLPKPRKDIKMEVDKIVHEYRVSYPNNIEEKLQTCERMPVAPSLHPRWVPKILISSYHRVHETTDDDHIDPEDLPFLLRKLPKAGECLPGVFQNLDASPVESDEPALDLAQQHPILVQALENPPLQNPTQRVDHQVAGPSRLVQQHPILAQALEQPPQVNAPVPAIPSGSRQPHNSNHFRSRLEEIHPLLAEALRNPPQLDNAPAPNPSPEAMYPQTVFEWLERDPSKNVVSDEIRNRFQCFNYPDRYVAFGKNNTLLEKPAFEKLQDLNFVQCTFSLMHIYSDKSMIEILQHVKWYQGIPQCTSYHTEGLNRQRVEDIVYFVNQVYQVDEFIIRSIFLILYLLELYFVAIDHYNEQHVQIICETLGFPYDEVMQIVDKLRRRSENGHGGHHH